MERPDEGELMGDRVRGLILLGVVLAAGIFIGSAVSQWNPLPSQEGVAPAPRNSTAAGLGRVRVEILNAGGKEGMARLATDLLRDSGFDVVYFGNAQDFDGRPRVRFGPRITLFAPNERRRPAPGIPECCRGR